MDMRKKCNILKFILLVSLPVFIWGCAGPATQTLPPPTNVQKVGVESDQKTGLENSGNKQPPPSTEQVKAKVVKERYIAPVSWKPTYALKKVDVKVEKSNLPQFKVGADIEVEGGKISLKEVVKQLANLKNLNVSWASDVDQEALVDVDIKADDNFWAALDNILRQLDYFYKFENDTIIIKYKDTKKYYLPVPFLAGKYRSDIGGDLLSSRTDESEGARMRGVLSIERNRRSSIWANIQNNLDKILDIDPWRVTLADIQAYCMELFPPQEKVTFSTTGDGASSKNIDPGLYDKCVSDRMQDLQAARARVTAQISKEEGEDFDVTKGKQNRKSEKNERNNKQASKSKGKTVSYQKTLNYKNKGIYYVIDKPLGIITVVAPRRLIAEIDNYFESLKEELYRQVVIEAKILEIKLDNESVTGIDWSDLLKNSSFSFKALFGNPVAGTDYGILYPTKGVKFLNQFQMAAKPFDLILNLLSEHGQVRVLSNPKLSLLNGQPALVTVGKRIDYLRQLVSDINTNGNYPIITYDTIIDTVLSGLAFGVTANISSDDEVLLQVTPIISKLLGFKAVPVGDRGDAVYLPTVELRELTTMARVKSGQILVIGGLISDVTEDSGNKVPLLGDVPVVGNAFKSTKKSTSKKELIVLLRPQIVDL